MVIELGRPGRAVIGDLLGMLETTVPLVVDRDPTGAEGMAVSLCQNSRHFSAALDDLQPHLARVSISDPKPTEIVTFSFVGIK